MTSGERYHPVARQGPALGLKSKARIDARLICGQKLFVKVSHDTLRRASNQELRFDVSFAADIAAPVICRMCSPAFVN